MVVLVVAVDNLNVLPNADRVARLNICMGWISPKESVMINLTQHRPSVEQTEAGVTCLPEEINLKNLLTFNEPPTSHEVKTRADMLARHASNAGAMKALIGGFPALMGPLEVALRKVGVTPYYAFSQRSCIETMKDDGTVVKTTVFKHVSFIEGSTPFIDENEVVAITVPPGAGHWVEATIREARHTKAVCR